jgi:hypothetical protein
MTFDGDEPGAVVRLEKDAIELRCERAKAPGSRPTGTLSNGMQLRVKVHRCKREDKGDGLVFTIEGRLIDGTRALQAELERLLTPGT